MQLLFFKQGLIHNQVIAVSPQSPLDAFDIDSEDFPNTFYTYRVTYFLNLIFPANKQDLFTEILDPNYYCPENADEAVMLWKEIAIAECIEWHMNPSNLFRQYFIIDIVLQISKWIQDVRQNYTLDT